MEKQQAFKQILEFNQAAFNHTFSAMTLLQEQTERMINLSLEQAAFLPKEGKKVYSEYLKAWTKGSEAFKKAVDAGFQQMAGFLA
jgi:hypothetical protein